MDTLLIVIVSIVGMAIFIVVFRLLKKKPQLEEMPQREIADPLTHECLDDYVPLSPRGLGSYPVLIVNRNTRRLWYQHGPGVFFHFREEFTYDSGHHFWVDNGDGFKRIDFKALSKLFFDDEAQYPVHFVEEGWNIHYGEMSRDDEAVIRATERMEDEATNLPKLV